MRRSLLPLRTVTACVQPGTYGLAAALGDLLRLLGIHNRGGRPSEGGTDCSDTSRALAFAGLRASEILGLARSDIDLERGTVTVRQQISGSGVRATLVETKTASSAATIALRWFVVERLRIHLAHLETERPIVPIGDWLVFVTERGLAVNGSWLTKHFQALLVHTGLPRVRLHDLRHGAASLLVDAGAHPRVVQELLRHAPGSRVTMERYAHVTAAKQRDAADLLDRALTHQPLTVTLTVTDPADGVVEGGPESPEEGHSRGESGSGGRTRTYDQAVNSRPLYH